uniref:Uncharacterized protein n=1 Tax=Opuntia streptacantha TaxID=393608 RepID=A0A7C9CFJ4_OPUST
MMTVALKSFVTAPRANVVAQLLKQHKNKTIGKKLHKEPAFSYSTPKFKLDRVRRRMGADNHQTHLNKIDSKEYIWIRICFTSQTGHSSNFILRFPVHTVCTRTKSFKN